MEQQLLPAQSKRANSPQPSSYSDPSTHNLVGLKPPDSEIVYRNPSERISFSEYTSLVLTIENAEMPLVFQPEPTSVFGRVGYEPCENTVINLTPFDAQNKGVSRLHAALYRNGKLLQIEDLSSRNGTYLNGIRLIPHELKVIHDGDQLRLGALIIYVSFQELPS